MLVRSTNQPNLVEIRPLGTSWHKRQIYDFVTFLVNFLFFATCTGRRLNRFDGRASIDADYPKEGPWGLVKNFFLWVTIPPQNFRKAISTLIENFA